MKRSQSAMLAIVSIAFVFFSGCVSIWADDTVPRDDIFSYVNNNYEVLEKFPYNEMEEIDSSIDYEEKDKAEKRSFENTLVIIQ